MNTKKAILTGALLWILIFFEVSILMFGLKLEGLTYQITHYILLIPLTAIAALIYFKNQTANIKESFMIGIIFATTGILLDAIITIPLFIKDYAFFLDTFLWIGIAEGILITTLIGKIKTI